MQHDVVATPKLKLQSIELWDKDVQVIILVEQAEIHAEKRVGLCRFPTRVPALINIDNELAESRHLTLLFNFQSLWRCEALGRGKL